MPSTFRRQLDPRSTFLVASSRPALVLGGWLTVALGCGGQDQTLVSGAPPTQPAVAPENPPGELPPASAAFPSLIEVTAIRFGDTEASTYVAFVDSLGGQRVDLSTAREFAGWASVATFDGWLFVGEGDQPVLHRYRVDADGRLGSDSTSLSFANYGFSDAPLTFNTFVDETMSHMSADQTSRILWNPSDMTISGVSPTPQVAPLRDGLEVVPANFEGRIARANDVLQPFFWHDTDWYEFHQYSQLAIYSREGGLNTLLDVPCPALQTATVDERGNAYFSGMADTIPFQLRESGPGRCIARIDAGADALADGWPKRFEELTDERPTGGFYYFKDGIGVLQVFHAESMDPQSDDFLTEWARQNWGLWFVDIENWNAQPISAWPLGSANVFFSQLGDRLFVHQVAPDFSETAIFELTLSGERHHVLTVPGYVGSPLLGVR